MAGPPVYALDRDWYNYTSDDTLVYQVGTTIANGTVNGATAITPGASPTYPRGWVMRHVFGNYVDTATGFEYRTKVPIFDPTNTKWVGSVNTFIKAGQTWQIEGRIGERRTYKGG